MNNRKLKKNIASYGALTAAFLASGTYEAEAQIVYMDPEDKILIATTSLNVTDAFMNGGTEFSNTQRNSQGARLDILNGTFQNLSSAARDSGNRSSNPYLDFYANAQIFAGRSSGYIRPCLSYSTGGSCTRVGAETNLVYSNVNIFGSGRGNRFKSDASSFVENIPYGDNVDGAPSGFNARAIGIAKIDFVVKEGRRTPKAVSLNSDYSGGFANDALDSEVEGYIGFKFDKNGQNHFGWARVKLEIEVTPEDDLNGSGARKTNTRGVSSVTTTLTIMDYAYNDTPDTAIAAGAMPAAAIPTMGQWGLVTLNLLLLIFGIVAVKDRDRLVIKKRA